MTQADLVRKMNVHASTVSRWVQGEEPKPRYLVRLTRLTKYQVLAVDFPVKGSRADPTRATVRRVVPLAALLGV